MFCNVFTDRRNDQILVWDDEEGLQKIPLRSLSYSYKKSPNGQYTSIFGEKLTRINKYDRGDIDSYESDVPLDTRLLIELYGDSDDMSFNHRLLVIDIETDIENGFPIIDEADKAITAISIYDDTSKKYHAYILDKDRLLSDSEDGDVIVKSFDNEENLLLHFLNKWDEFMPTIVTGWNSRGTYSGTVDGVGFDMIYIYNRLKRLFGIKEANRLSPVGICYVTKHKKELVIAGVCTALDYYPLYKRYSGTREQSYKLGRIGFKEVGIDKVHFEGSLNNLYKTDIKKYIEYNLNDVRIVVKLHEKYNYIDLARGICHFCHVPYEYYDVSSRFLEGAVLTYLKRLNLVACNKPINGQEEYLNNENQDEEGFDGAYVKEPVPGKYEWVYDLDMQSLYPSIIQTLNISPETIVGKINDWYPLKYVSEEYTNIHFNTKDYTVSEFTELLKHRNYSIAANGMVYKNDSIGIIPAVIEKWLNDRKEIRKQAKIAKETKDEHLFQILNRKQVVFKILANSIYGCLGLPSWRFYNKDNAEATTLTGVLLIQSVDKMVNDYYHRILGETDVDYVKYADTDSCFASALPLIDKLYPNRDLNNEAQMVDYTLEITRQVQEYLNSMFHMFAIKFFNTKNHKFFIKQEMIAKSGIWLAKKRYAQWVINNAGINVQEMDVKGIDTVRSSFPLVFSTFLKQTIEKMLRGVARETIDDNILEFRSRLSTFSIFDIGKSTSVRYVSGKGDINYNPKNRQPFQTIKGSPAQVKAALYYGDLLKKWGLEKRVEPIYNGQKIKFIYLRDNEYGIGEIALKADDTDPKEILDFAMKYNDYTKMYEKELESKLKQFYEVLKWVFPTENFRIAQEFFEF